MSLSMNLITIPAMVKAIRELDSRLAKLEENKQQLTQRTEAPLPAPRRGRPPKEVKEDSDEAVTAEGNDGKQTI